MIHVCVLQQYNRLHNVTKPYILLLMSHAIFSSTEMARLSTTFVINLTGRQGDQKIPYLKRNGLKDKIYGLIMQRVLLSPFTRKTTKRIALNCDIERLISETCTVTATISQY